MSGDIKLKVVDHNKKDRGTFFLVGYTDSGAVICENREGEVYIFPSQWVKYI